MALCRLLDEIGVNHGRYDAVYGRVQTLDRDTRTLCEWCKAHAERIKEQSLELQIWWRDHQKADKEKADRAAADRVLRETQRGALDKLTDEEIRALGLRIRESDDE